MNEHVPDAGDIFWLELDPVLGSEQAGRRPAIVMSDRLYHEVSPRALVCPITSNLRPWPFNTWLPTAMTTEGAVLVDQIRAIDRRTRLFRYIESAPPEVVLEVRAKLAALLGMTPAMR